VILQLLLISSVDARCNLELFRFGSSYSEIEKQLGNMPKTSASSENMLFAPGEMVCKDDKSLARSPVFFIFADDKLVQIIVKRYTMNGKGNLSLIEWAESIYGERENKPKSFYAKKPDASFYWDSFNSLVHYFIENDESGFRENVIIESRRHKKLLEKFFSETGKSN
jgi:hypothetical protein